MLLAKIHERHKQFHQAIARRAEMLLRREPIPSAPPPPVLPPIPNALIAEACEIISPSWKGSIKKIQLAVCKEYGVTFNELVSQRRWAKLSFARQVAMYLCKKLTAKSLPEISRLFGNRDHTTVLHGVRKIERLLATDPELRARVDAIAESLGGVVE